MGIEELETEVLKLDPSTRARLAERLLQSLETLSEAENERLWTEEAERRLEELDKGTVTARPSDEVLRNARAHLA
jgi:putative addiction module component (TIGR02574 family)